MKNKCVLCLILLATISLSPELSAQPEYKCHTNVFLYIDLSGSLNRIDKTLLAQNLGQTLKSDVQGVIADERTIYLLPFAEKVARDLEPITASQSTPVDGAAIVRSMSNVFGREPGTISIGDAKKTNVAEVINDINSRLHGSRAKGAVFIIVSDFEHDVTDEDEDVDKQKDRADWQRAEVAETLKEMKRRFSPSQPGGVAAPVLILLSLPTSELALNIGVEVLHDLDELAEYEAQIRPAEGLRNISSLLQFIKPLEIRSEVVGDSGRRVNRITVENRSCINLPELILKREFLDRPQADSIEPPADLTGKSLIFRLNNGSMNKETFTLDVPTRTTASTRPYDAEINIYVELADGRLGFPPLAMREVNFDPYAELARFIGTPSDMNLRAKDLRAQFRRGYSEVPLRIDLRLYRDPETPASQVFSVKLPVRSDTTPALEEHRVELKIDDAMLPAYCCEKKYREGKLLLRVETYREDVRLESKDLPVIVDSGDGASIDLLEDLAQQGSLPVLATVWVLSIMAWRSAHLTLGHVEELIAVAGLLFVTMFLLAHRIPYLGHLMDLMLIHRFANWTGAGICFSLSILIISLAFRGTVLSARTSSEIDRIIEADVVAVREGKDQSSLRAGLWWVRFSFAILCALLVLALGFVLLWHKPMPDCALVVQGAPADLQSPMP